MIDYALLSADHVPLAYALEVDGFPPDEAASLHSLQSRQQNAGQYFLGAYESDKLIGFVCATLTPSSTLTHDSMSTHVPGAPFVAIHSVCIAKEKRRQGVAVGLLEEYIKRLATLGAEEVKGARLITHDELIPLYSRAGFTLVGPSKVVHGAKPWFEMAVDFPSSTTTSSQPKDVEAEEDPATVRNPGKTFASVSNRSAELYNPTTNLNTADIFCPRAECRCLLFRSGTAKYVRPSQKDTSFELPNLPRPIDSPAPPSTSVRPEAYWSLSSPLAFENIGFSRTAPSQIAPPPSSSSAVSVSGSTPQIKYLICADCDHGPLGWHDTEGRDLGVEVAEENEGLGDGPGVRQGREFLVAVERVRYRFKEEGEKA